MKTMNSESVAVTESPRKTDALSILAALRNVKVSRDKREKRLRVLLRSPEAADDGWFMHVPTVFNDALDIRLTKVVEEPKPVWTQGANFAFSAGDTFYDTSAGYEVWKDALKKVRTCLQVSLATAVTPPTGGAVRNPGSVTFSVFAPNETRTALTKVRTCTVTQDDFVQLLIAGFPDELPLSSG